MKPELSVITTVYNCEKYIEESVNSILKQTYGNFEYIIVDDGSTDNTSNAISRISETDIRIKYIRSKKNLGRVKALNLALRNSNGKYIAIQDADDISLSERFEKQIEFFKNNPEYVLLGSDITVIDPAGKIISTPIRPSRDEEIRFNLLFKCTLANPSIMFRKSVLDENKIQYEEDFNYAEDFRIYTHITEYGKAFNLKDKLILYRNHPVNSSNKNIRIVAEDSAKVVVDNFKKYGIDIKVDEAIRIRKLIALKGMDDKYLLSDMKLILKIIKSFQEKAKNLRNESVLSTLKKMMRWPGKKNLLTNTQFSAMQISILKYYIKQAKLQHSKS